MDIDLTSRSQDMDEDNTDLNPIPELEHYENYSEIHCSTVMDKADKKTAQGKELIKQRPEDSKVNPFSSKMTRVFDLNPHTLLIVTIQGKVVEVSVKYISYNMGSNNYESENLTNSNSLASKFPTVTKRFNDHTSDLLQEMVLQALGQEGRGTSWSNFSLYYCSKDLTTVYCLQITISENSFQAFPQKIGINTEYNYCTTFSVSYDSREDKNTIIFGSNEVEGVLVSNQTTFGRKQESNERLNLTQVKGQGNILKAKLGSLFQTVKKRITRAERTESHCIKLQ